MMLLLLSFFVCDLWFVGLEVLKDVRWTYFLKYGASTAFGLRPPTSELRGKESRIRKQKAHKTQNKKARTFYLHAFFTH